MREGMKQDKGWWHVAVCTFQCDILEKLNFHPNLSLGSSWSSSRLLFLIPSWLSWGCVHCVFVVSTWCKRRRGNVFVIADWRDWKCSFRSFFFFFFVFCSAKAIQKMDQMLLIVSLIVCPLFMDNWTLCSNWMKISDLKWSQDSDLWRKS